MEGNVQNLMAACKGAGAKPEGDHDKDSIAKTLKGVLADPKRTVADVGATIDALYLFGTEV